MLFANQAQASSVVVDATGSGLCRNDGFDFNAQLPGSSSTLGCNNDNRNVLRNNFAGELGPVQGKLDFRNWFSFDLPVGPVTGAVLSIFNDGRNFTQQPGTDYTIKGVTTINHAGLGAGAILGSINVAAADTGVDHYVDIVLNAAAITQLNSFAGGSFLFGGSVNSASADINYLFGVLDPAPRPAYLTLSNDPVINAVPEPASWALIIAGFGLTGAAMRRRQVVLRTPA